MFPNQPQPGMPMMGGRPGPQQQDPFQMIWQSIGNLEKNQQQIVEHINKWVAKIQGIDSVAFAALAMHEGKEFKLTPEEVDRIQKDIQDVLAEMGRYREVMRDQARVAEAETAAKSVGNLPQVPVAAPTVNVEPSKPEPADVPAPAEPTPEAPQPPETPEAAPVKKAKGPSKKDVKDDGTTPPAQG
jgi:hypothetical protein